MKHLCQWELLSSHVQQKHSSGPFFFFNSKSCRERRWTPERSPGLPAAALLTFVGTQYCGALTLPGTHPSINPIIHSASPRPRRFSLLIISVMDGVERAEKVQSPQVNPADASSSPTVWRPAPPSAPPGQRSGCRPSPSGVPLPPPPPTLFIFFALLPWVADLRGRWIKGDVARTLSAPSPPDHIARYTAAAWNLELGECVEYSFFLFLIKQPG